MGWIVGVFLLWGWLIVPFACGGCLSFTIQDTGYIETLAI